MVDRQNNRILHISFTFVHRYPKPSGVGKAFDMQQYCGCPVSSVCTSDECMGDRGRSRRRCAISSVKQSYTGRNWFWRQLGNSDSGNLFGNMEADRSVVCGFCDAGHFFCNRSVQK